MYRIIDSRGSGKTSRLMLIAKENNAKFACSNPHVMEAKAHAYGIIGLEFISYGDLLKLGSKNDTVVIDEMESFVRYVITNTGNLIGYSLSNQD